MTTLAHYLQTRYVRGGRGPVDYDCWGLVRDARVALFGKPLLPLLADTQPGNVHSITRAVAGVSAMHRLVPVPANPGAIATAWCASLCVHVGLVVLADGQLRILETDDPGGPSLTAINKFQARYTRVLFYDDQDLPQQSAR